MPDTNIEATLTMSNEVEARLIPEQGIQTQTDIVYLCNPDAIKVKHDETLEGEGTSSSPLKISDEILQEIEDAGKVDDVYVNGVSVLAADKIAYVIVPTNVSDLNNDLNFQTLTQVSNAISVHNESSTAHADIRQDIANVSDSIATSIATHNTSVDAHSNIISPIAQTLDSHVTNKSNPHEVTKAQVGLGNVDNTSDLDKPISTATQAALNAQQEEIDALSGRGRFLSLWNCVTGLPETDPETESPYVYHTGDYYIVGTVSSATPAVNYKPSGSSYVFDPAPVPSSVVETGEVSVNDTYVYDGENWILQSNAQKEVSFSALAGSPYDNTALGNALNSKQNTLTAGTNISIVNDVISSTAQESFFRGKWSTWNDVPSVSSLYPEDYNHNRVPTENDYMVVADASGYAGVGSDFFNKSDRTYYLNKAIAGGWDLADRTGSLTIDLPVSDMKGNKCGFAILTSGFKIRNSKYIIVGNTTNYGVFTADASATYAVSYQIPNNYDYIRIELDKTDGTEVTEADWNNLVCQLYAVGEAGECQGTWRFGYHGVWSTDSKNGWKPEYQVENTLPEATDSVKGIAKLYNTTGNNTDGSMTQASVTTALGTKQDTLTAGTNIDITNNVISATSYESFFRGSFDTWALVPTDPTLYKVDFHGNTTPLKNDYMVVTDASGYINPDFADDPDNVSIKRNSTAYTIDITVGGTTISVVYTKINQTFRTIRYLFEDAGYTGIGCEWLEVIYYPGAPGQWWVKATGDYYINNVAKNGSVFLMNTNTSVDDVYYLSQDPGVAPLPISGSWRFRYVSVWSQKGKVGWQAEYQVEETLPNASDTEAGIAKLYNTTGNNTDGSMTQSSVTTALSGKQDTLTAGTNISIVNNVISATAQESFFRGSFVSFNSVPTNPADYLPDYTGNTTPTQGDFIVVADASDYVGTEFAPAIRIVTTSTGIKITILETGEEYNYTSAGVADITQVGNTNFYIQYISYWKLSSSQVFKINGNTYTYFIWSYSSSVDFTADTPVSYYGSWRFGYDGIWSTDGRTGWKPQYQIEKVLPVADSTKAGIAKLYTTTGSNTDGAIDQNGTTTAINTAVSTHNTDTNAHNNLRGSANGIATLDGNAKVPLTQINDALLGNVSYQGLWNAATNTPYLQDPSGGLPDGYNVLEYIDFDNGQYIDTGVSIDSTFDTVGYDIKFLINQATNTFPFGSTQDNYYGGSGCPIFSGWQNNEAYPNYFIANDAGIALGSALNLNTECEITILVDKNNQRISVWKDGGSETTSSYSGTIYANSITLGCLHAANAHRFHLFGRIYYFAIKKNGEVIKRYQPAQRISDNAYGFYELVSGTFVTATGGTFTSGGGSIEIPKGHYYITSTAGTQFGIHFEVGDWVISNGTSWTKVDNTDAVSSVEGRTGNVTVINDSASTGATTYTWSADKLATQFGSLGSAAYTASTDYATSAQGAKADTALQSADVQEYTANEVETLWNSI